MPPPPVPSRSGQQHALSRSSGPQIFTPPNLSFGALFPNLPQLAQNPGYTEAHAAYEEMRSFFQGRAMSTGNGYSQTITIRCWLARMGRQKELTIDVRNS